MTTCTIPGRDVDCIYDCRRCPLSYVISDGVDERAWEIAREAEGQ